VPTLLADGALKLLDAEITLATFMDGTKPDIERFRSTIRTVITDSLRQRRDSRVYAFGEMVDLLWRHGNPDAAVHLERLWNQLGAEFQLRLLCSYRMRNFSKGSDAAYFMAICEQHGHVLPTAEYSLATDSPARLREVARLQQRAEALENEIRERKRLEAELEATIRSERLARENAERASRMKDEFLSSVSHELRTPLNVILGWTQILETPRDPAMIRRGLDMIGRHAHLQQQIINDLLDASSMLSGKLSLQAREIPLVPVLDRALEMVQPTAAEKAIRIEWDIDPSVHLVFADPDRLQQILWNLLANSVKFTPKEGRVKLTVDREPEFVRIQVSDTGIGIRPDFLPHVFERFRQADGTPSRRHGGLGLGLAIVKHLVEAHAGFVSADSEGEGRGATFTVKVPVDWPGRK
jgi:signal transduction histidine kinase